MISELVNAAPMNVAVLAPFANSMLGTKWKGNPSVDGESRAKFTCGDFPL